MMELYKSYFKAKSAVANMGLLLPIAIDFKSCSATVPSMPSLSISSMDQYEKLISSSVDAETGYIKRTVLNSYDPDHPVEMTSYHNLDGAYIGDKDFADALFKRGIAPQLASDNHKVCSIGYSEKEDKWYGWSHRAMYGFGVGSEVNPGDCAYSPDNMESFMQSKRDWHDNASNISVVPVGGNKVQVNYTIMPVNGGTPIHNNYESDFVPGRGSWTAATMGDAKQMALDFAESVSCSYVPSDYPTQAVSVEPEYRKKLRSVLGEIHQLFSETAAQNLSYANQVGRALESTAAIVNLATMRPASEGGDELSELVDKQLKLENFAWYEYTDKKVAKYKHHEKTYQMEVENEELFGLTYDAKAEAYLLVTSDMFGRGFSVMSFRLTKRQVQALIKKSDPYKGSIGKTKVVAGNGKPDQSYHGNTNIKVTKPKVAVKKQVKPEPKTSIIADKSKVAAKPKTAKAKKTKKMPDLWAAYYMEDTFTQKVVLLGSLDLDALKDRLTKNMSRLKTLGSFAQIIKLSSDNVFYERLAKAKGTRLNINPAHRDVLRRSTIETAQEFKPEGISMQNDGVQVPEKSKGKPVREEPLFLGNEYNVLAELRDNIILGKHFSAGFDLLNPKAYTAVGQFQSHNERTGRRTRVGIVEAKNHLFLQLVSKHYNDAYLVEGKALARRVQEAYRTKIGSSNISPMKTSVSTKELKLKSGIKKYVVVRIELVMPKSLHGSHATRAKAIYELAGKGVLLSKVNEEQVNTNRTFTIPVGSKLESVKVIDVERDGTYLVKGVQSGITKKVNDVFDKMYKAGDKPLDVREVKRRVSLTRLVFYVDGERADVKSYDVEAATVTAYLLSSGKTVETTKLYDLNKKDILNS